MVLEGEQLGDIESVCYTHFQRHNEVHRHHYHDHSPDTYRRSTLHGGENRHKCIGGAGGLKTWETLL